MQVMQTVCRDSRRAECSHRRANSGVEHPRRKCCYDARLDLNVEDCSASTLLAVVSSYTVAVKRMPRIVNYNFSPDMCVIRTMSVHDFSACRSGISRHAGQGFQAMSVHRFMACRSSS